MQSPHKKIKSYSKKLHKKQNVERYFDCLRSYERQVRGGSHKDGLKWLISLRNVSLNVHKFLEVAIKYKFVI